MPNPNGRLTSIVVSLSSNNGSAILGNRTTWVTIHGRDSSPAALTTVSRNLRTSTGDQVLQLDWSPGAGDNSPALTGLQGAEWIPYVSDWASSTLRAIGLVGSQVQLVGHSWGSYVAQRIGAIERLGTVNSIVALDPARMGKGIPESGPDAIHFGAVSSMSWAFYGNGSWGSAPISGTARESFIVNMNDFSGPTYLHGTPILFFEIVTANTNYMQGLFNINRLKNRQLQTVWTHNRFRSGVTISGLLGEKVFEGEILVDSRLNVSTGVWSFNPLSFTYIASSTDRPVQVRP
jgi:pimeloyl-ACP methyl ester carboxylesterase